MRYNINARFIYDATDGTLMLSESTEPDSQLSLTASALFYFFLRNTGIISREEVLKKVWDDNGLTSSNSNLNQYLSMLRKTFRYYGIDNIIVSVSRGYLQLNPDVNIEIVDEPSTLQSVMTEFAPAEATLEPLLVKEELPHTLHTRGMCWYIAGACLLTISLLLVLLSQVGVSKSHPINLTQITHSKCELLASDEMLRSATVSAYVINFDKVRQQLNLACKPGERFLFFYGDRLETNGLGRVFLAHCAMHEDNPFSYCDNYFYYSWKP